jgi:hypothetical protein
MLVGESLDGRPAESVGRAKWCLERIEEIEPRLTPVEDEMWREECPEAMRERTIFSFSEEIGFIVI